MPPNWEHWCSTAFARLFSLMRKSTRRQVREQGFWLIDWLISLNFVRQFPMPPVVHRLLEHNNPWEKAFLPSLHQTTERSHEMGFSHSGGHRQQSSHRNTYPATHPRYQGTFTLKYLIEFMVPCRVRFFILLTIMFQLWKPIPLKPRQSLRVKNCSVKWGTRMSALCAVHSDFSLVFSNFFLFLYDYFWVLSFYMYAGYFLVILNC